MRSKPSVAVIGGGLAGIAASTALMRAGLDVTLIERRKLLGGRATSFEDQQTGELLDNCQHVLLGCCTELIELYRTLGVSEGIEWFGTITFADQTGRRGSLSASNLPSPLHLAGAMARFPLLTLSQKAQITHAMAAMWLIRDPAFISTSTFGQWLTERGQAPDTVARFWNVILTSALNEDAANVAAAYGMQVFQQAFLGDRNGYVMGVPNVPLSRLYESVPAARLLTGRRVITIEPQTARSGFGVILDNGQLIDADILIIATAPDAAGKLLEGILPIPQFTYRPIIGLHLFFDRPVMSEAHLALIGTELQWLFRKDTGGRHVHGVISAATAQAEESNDTLLPRLMEEIHRLLPDSAGARLVNHRIIKEKRATFSPAPGIDRVRPDQTTALPGLFLAGDYTQTTWPATMEGAVRSGNLAAAAVARSLNRHKSA